MSHTCHAAGCSVRVPPEMFLCKRHWFMLPKKMRDRIWHTYRDGQCDDWNISHEYAEAAKAAIQYLGMREKQPQSVIDKACQVYRVLDPLASSPDPQHGSDERPASTSHPTPRGRTTSRRSTKPGANASTPPPST
jgi:hypothetical protein